MFSIDAAIQGDTEAPAENDIDDFTETPNSIDPAIVAQNNDPLDPSTVGENRPEGIVGGPVATTLLIAYPVKSSASEDISFPDDPSQIP